MFTGRIVFCSLYYCKAIGNTDNVYSKPVKTSGTHRKTQSMPKKHPVRGVKHPARGVKRPVRGVKRPVSTKKSTYTPKNIQSVL